jgi:hypothetical protein
MPTFSLLALAARAISRYRPSFDGLPRRIAPRGNYHLSVSHSDVQPAFCPGRTRMGDEHWFFYKDQFSSR